MMMFPHLSIHHVIPNDRTDMTLPNLHAKLLSVHLPTRFFPLCLGSEEQAQSHPSFVTLPQLMREHVKAQRADLLKVRKGNRTLRSHVCSLLPCSRCGPTPLHAGRLTCTLPVAATCLT